MDFSSVVAKIAQEIGKVSDGLKSNAILQPRLKLIKVTDKLAPDGASDEAKRLAEDPDHLASIAKQNRAMEEVGKIMAK